MDDKYNMDIDEIIKYWEAALPPSVDYAEMVGAPAGHYGIKYVYEDPEGYIIEDTITALKELKQLREYVNDAISNIEENNKQLLEMLNKISGEE